MKIGDQKQAITLGVVAVVAVGFLAKTAFGSFKGISSSRPMEVKDLRGGPAPTSNPANPAPKNESNATPSTSTAVHPSVESNKTTGGNDEALLLVKDAFAKFPVQGKVGPRSESNLSMSNIPKESFGPTVKEGPSIPPAVPLTGQIEGGPMMTGDGKETGKTDRKSEQGTEPVKKETVTMRFDGYVNAGKPMAVLTFKGDSYTLSVGDTIGDWKIETISNEKVTICKGKSIKTIFVGREIEF